MAYESWLKAMKPEIPDFFSELERAIENWYHEILNISITGSPTHLRSQ